MQLTSDWTVIDNVDEGEILAKILGNLIYVRYPTCLPFNVMEIILMGIANIDIGNDLTFLPNPPEGETIAVFSDPY